MNFFKVLDNNVCTISGNGFIRVQGPIVVSSSQQSYSQQLYSFSNSVESSAFDFEEFNTSLSDTSFVFTNSNTFSVGSTNYTEVTLNDNKIEFTDEVYIELPDDIDSSTYTKYTKTDGAKEYILYENTNNGLYDIVVIFDCTNDTVEVKQLYHAQQIGSDIDGASNSDESGTSVSLSYYGNIVAIGEPKNNSSTGKVKVYQRDISNTSTGWTQIGGNIGGEKSGDESGSSVSLSADGTIVAIGAIYNDADNSENDTKHGHVRVYEYKNNTWTQLGEDIDGENIDDNSGFSVSLSSNGKIVAIGAILNDADSSGNDTKHGHVRVYQYKIPSEDEWSNGEVANGDDTDQVSDKYYWVRLGSDIDGEGGGNRSGNSVSLSSDETNGMIVAIGAKFNNGNGTNSGHVRVYEYKIPNETNEWENSDAIIAGAIYNTSTNTRGSYNDNTKYWVRLGEDIDGEFMQDFSGYSVSLSSDETNGIIVAIGATRNNTESSNPSGDQYGHVRVYKYDSDNENTPIGWAQLGNDIDGENNYDYSGTSVSLSSDETNGVIVAISSRVNENGENENNDLSGRVQIYKYNSNNSTWVKIYKNIDGENAGDYSGHSVSLSGDGGSVAIGAPKHDSSKGTTRIYRLPSNPILEIKTSDNSSIYVQGPVIVNYFSQSYSQQTYSFASSSIIDVSDFENYTETISSDNTYSFSLNTFTIGSTDYQSVTLNGNKIEFTDDIFIQLPDSSDSYNGLTIKTKNNGEGKEYILYESILSLYDIVVIFNCTNNTVEVKQLYHEQKLGNDIDGQPGDSESGTSISLSSDGSVVAIGAPQYTYNDNVNYYSGLVRVYKYNPTKTTLYSYNDEYDVGEEKSGVYNNGGPLGWDRRGANIYGIDVNGGLTNSQKELCGTSVSLSSDGTIIAIGFPNANKINTNIHGVGLVRVYEFKVPNSTEWGNSDVNKVIKGEYEGNPLDTFRKFWVQVGSDIVGDIATEHSGDSVSLSSDGTIVAIGSPNTDNGKVKVYNYNGTSWSQLGNDIDGEASGDRFGNSVSLSSNGNVIIVGGPLHDWDSNEKTNGISREYKYKVPNETNEWNNSDVIIAGAIYDTSTNTRGPYDANTKYWVSSCGLVGQRSQDKNGYAVSINSDGTIIAAGAYQYENDNEATTINTDRGRVRILEYRIPTSEEWNDSNIYIYANNSRNSELYDANTKYWVRLGEDIVGENINDHSGYSVSLSDDGYTIAIGSIGSTELNSQNTKGILRVYRYDETNNTWVKIYKDIDGEASGDQSGFSVSLSSGGNVVAIGAPNHDSSKGTTRIYRLPSNPIADIDSTTISSSNYITLEKKPYSITETSHVSIETYEGLISSLGENDGFTGNTGINISDFYLDDISYTGINITGSHIQFDGSNVYFDIGNGVTAGTEKTIENTTSTNSKLQILYDILDSHYMVAELDCLHNTANVVRYNKALQLGENIDGEAEDDNSGWSVSLSSDGTIVAIGAIYNDAGNSTTDDRGHVRVFQWREYTTDDKENDTYHHTSYTQDSSQTKSLIITGSTSTAPVVGSYYWTQLGKDIDGEAEDDNSGWSVSLSSNGTIVAIGAVYNGANEYYRGHVRVYEYKIPSDDEWSNGEVAKGDDNSQVSDTKYWVRLGEDIDGENEGDESGYSVSLSSDGTIVAIGAYLNNGGGTDSGHVRVYQRDTSNTESAPIGWAQLGNDIDGENNYDYSGWSVSLSSDGTIVAIGADSNDGVNGNNSGHVRVYEYKIPSDDEWSNGEVAKGDDNSQVSDTKYWVRLGEDIDGENGDDYSGTSVSLSSDGTIVAIGAIYNDAGNSENDTKHGHVRVYKYIDESWTQLGEDIDGENAGDYSGWSVSLSSDGSIVAIGAYKNSGDNGSRSGHVRIYKYNESSNTWVKIYKDIDGENEGDESGQSVSLSSDGRIVVIGADRNDGNGNKSGHVRVYRLIPEDTQTQTLGVKYRTGKDIVEEEVSPSQVGGYNYLIDN